MAKKTKQTPAEVTAMLADYIEKGKKLVREDRYVYLDEFGGKVCGCAVGMAYVGFFGKEGARASLGDVSGVDSLNFFARAMQVPLSLFIEVESAHLGRHRASTIIRHLRQGKFDEFVNA